MIARFFTIAGCVFFIIRFSLRNYFANIIFSCSTSILNEKNAVSYLTEIELFVEGQAFSRSYDFDPRPTPPLPPAKPATHRKTEKERKVADERGWGKGATAGEPGPL
jgi:hypothetical protein